MISTNVAKIFALTLFILGAWFAFFYCLHTGQSKDIIEGVGCGAGLLTFFGIIAISEMN